MGIVGIAFIGGDILRQRKERINKLFTNIFKYLIRPQEKNQLAATTYYVAGCFLSILLFSKIIASLSVLFLALGDSAAKISGKTFGRRKIGNKSLAGSIAIFLICFISAIGIFKLNHYPHPFVLAIAGAGLATVAEFFPKIDNLTIPLFAGAAMSVVESIL